MEEILEKVNRLTKQLKASIDLSVEKFDVYVKERNIKCVVEYLDRLETTMNAVKILLDCPIQEKEDKTTKFDKIITCDLALLPRGWNLDKWVDYLKKYNINVIDTFGINNGKL